MRTLTPSQVVAYRLRKARDEIRGLSQTEAAEQLRKYGLDFSKQVLSGAEISFHVDAATKSDKLRRRLRSFSVDEVVAFSKAFDLPLLWFLLPPPPSEVRGATKTYSIGSLRSEGIRPYVSVAGLIDKLFEVTDTLTDELAHLLGDLGPKAKTKAQQKASALAVAYAAGLLRERLGDAEAQANTLRSVADLLEEIAETPGEHARDRREKQ